MTRPYGSGSLYRVGDRWIFARSLQEAGKRVRRVVTAKTPEEALELAATRTDWGPPASRLARQEAARRAARLAALREIHSGDHLTGRQRRARALSYVERVIRASQSEGWTAEYAAQVIFSTLRPTRIRHAVFGPCVYCGDWLATEIDHVIPTARGGTDDPENVVSACHPCNSSKADKTPEEWLRMRLTASGIASNG